MRRAALYLRISTDRAQTTDNQLDEVHQLVVARGYEPVIYEEVESAAKARPVLDRVMGDVRAGGASVHGMTNGMTAQPL